MAYERERIPKVLMLERKGIHGTGGARRKGAKEHDKLGKGRRHHVGVWCKKRRTNTEVGKKRERGTKGDLRRSGWVEVQGVWENCNHYGGPQVKIKQNAGEKEVGGNEKLT